MLISFTELANKSLQLYKNNFVLFLKYIILNLIVPLLSSLLMSVVVMFLLPFVKAGGLNVVFIVVGTIIFLTITIGLFYFTSWFSFTLIFVVYERQAGRNVGGIIENLKKIQPLVWRGIGASLLAGLYIALPLLIALSGWGLISFYTLTSGTEAARILNLVFVLLVLLGVYGIFHAIYFGIKLQFNVYAVLFDAKKPAESIKFSQTLVRGRWWSVLLKIIVPGALLWVITALTSYLPQVLASLAGNIVGVAMATIVWVCNVLLWQFMIIIIVLLYNNLKTVPTKAPPALPTN